MDDARFLVSFLYREEKGSDVNVATHHCSTYCAAPSMLPWLSPTTAISKRPASWAIVAEPHPPAPVTKPPAAARPPPAVAVRSGRPPGARIYRLPLAIIAACAESGCGAGRGFDPRRSRLDRSLGGTGGHFAVVSAAGSTCSAPAEHRCVSGVDLAQSESCAGAQQVVHKAV